MCSIVHTLLNRKKLKNSVVALRAVLVMDMVRAPNCLVMAAEQDEPKNPMVLNKIMIRHLLVTEYVRSSSGVPFKYC